jgi:tetratricopeptide (TPR) repeat protein
VLIVVVIVARRERGIALLLGCAMLPMLQIVPVARWWSPHYLYVPFAFVAMRAASFAEERLRKRATLVVGIAAALLGALTLYEGQRYGDDASLWAPEVTRQPGCREGQFYLGEVERSAKQWDAAARRYEAALAPRPSMLAYVDKGAALQNLGTVRLEQGRFGDARRAFASALEGTSDPQRRRELTHDLAAASFGDGDPSEALRLLASELERPDAMRPSLLVAKAALEKLGRHEEARRVAERLSK